MEGNCLVCNNSFKTPPSSSWADGVRVSDQLLKKSVIFEAEKLRCIRVLLKLLYLPSDPFQGLLEGTLICGECITKFLQTEVMLNDLELLQGKIVQTRRDVETILIRSHSLSTKLALPEVKVNIDTKQTRSQIITLLRLKTEKGSNESGGPPFQSLAEAVAEEFKTMPILTPPDIASTVKTERRVPRKTNPKLRPSTSISAPMDDISFENHSMHEADSIISNTSRQSRSSTTSSYNPASLKSECLNRSTKILLPRISTTESSIRQLVQESKKPVKRGVGRPFGSKGRSQSRGRGRPAGWRGKYKGARSNATSNPSRASPAPVRTPPTSSAPSNRTSGSPLASRGRSGPGRKPGVGRPRGQKWTKSKIIKLTLISCPKCPEKFTKYSKLEEHQAKVHGQGGADDFVCGVCSKPFASMDILHSHMKVHVGSGISNGGGPSGPTRFISNEPKTIPSTLYKCENCPRRFRDIEALHDHNSRVHFGPKHECSHCERKYSSIQALKSHMNAHHPGETLPNGVLESVNGFGNEEIENPDSPIIEMDRDEPSPPPKAETDVHFECKICKKRFFSGIVLKIHEMNHRQCEVCSIIFSNHQALLGHKNAAHPDPNSKGVGLNSQFCILCERTFGTKGELNAHYKRVHVNSQPFESESEYSPPPDLQAASMDFDVDPLGDVGESPPNLNKEAPTLRLPNIKDLGNLYFPPDNLMD